MKKYYSRMAVTVLVAGLVFGTRAAQAATYYWTGAVSQDWHQASNWRPAAVPTEADTAIIGSGFTVRSSKPVVVGGASFGSRTNVNFGSTALINGPLSLSNVTWTSTGDLTVNGQFTMASASLVGSGLVTINGPGDVSNSRISNGNTLAINSRFSSTDSTFAGLGIMSLNSGANLTFLSSTTTQTPPGNIVDRPFSNLGTTTWSNGNIVVNQVFTNQRTGILDVQSTGSLGGKATNSFFNNRGTLKRTGIRGQSTLDIRYTNSGVTSVDTGTLAFTQSFDQTGGLCRLNGGSIAARTGLNIKGGILDGIGTISGGVSLSGGFLKPGRSPGSIIINGNYTQTANGTLELELGGTTPGTGHDQLVVNGSATLAGTLSILPYAGFTPVHNSNFVLVEYYSLAGNFTTVKSGYPPNYSFSTTLTPIYIVATAKISSDITVPTASTTAPIVNGVYTTLTSANGTAADNVGVTAVTVQLRRYPTAVTPNGYWAGGSTWTAGYSAANERPASGTTNWSVVLPSLSYGAYAFRPIAKDAVGNASNAPMVGFLKTNGNSPITASTVVATAATNTVRINFTGALDNVVAQTPGHYAILLSLNNQKIAIQSATYNGVTNSVTLTVASGALVKGSGITVAWPALFDTAGRLVSGKTGVLTVQ